MTWFSLAKGGTFELVVPQVDHISSVFSGSNRHVIIMSSKFKVEIIVPRVDQPVIAETLRNIDFTNVDVPLSPPSYTWMEFKAGGKGHLLCRINKSISWSAHRWKKLICLEIVFEDEFENECSLILWLPEEVKDDLLEVFSEL